MKNSKRRQITIYYLQVTLCLICKFIVTLDIIHVDLTPIVLMTLMHSTNLHYYYINSMSI